MPCHVMSTLASRAIPKHLAFAPASFARLPKLPFTSGFTPASIRAHASKAPKPQAYQPRTRETSQTQPGNYARHAPSGLSSASAGSPLIHRVLRGSLNTATDLQFWRRVILIFANAFALLHLCSTYVLSTNLTIGPSMLPTIEYSYDRVFISHLHRRGRWVKVGDIVSFDHPMRDEYRSIKRVIGMPGDFVLRDTPPDGVDMVYGEQEVDLEEGQTLGGLTRQEIRARRAAVRGKEHWMMRVPEGHCWVEGDNLEMSRDSRDFGAIPLALIRGRVLAASVPGKGIRWLGNGLSDSSL